MFVANDRDAKIAFETICMTKMLTREHPDKNKNAEEFLINLKRDLRRYLKKESDRRILFGEYDSYVELIKLPDFVHSKEQAKRYFEDNELLVCRPSIYDCTGQRFTISFAVAKRPDAFYVYHTVGLDL